MSNYTNLRNGIISVIKTNGNNEITGQLLQNELLAMITTLGYGYQFMGIATPTTNPGTPDAKVFYLAYTPGTYTNFGGIAVTGFCVLKYATSWVKEDIPVSGGGGGTEFTPEPTDLTLVSGTPNVLKFADRPYNSVTPDGLGYKILRKDLTFAQQVTDANTIYEIRYKFDLNGGTVQVPANCVLRFNGGSINNGTLSLSSAVKMVGSGEENDKLRINLDGVNNVEISGLSFVGEKADGVGVTADDLIGLLYNENTVCNNFVFDHCTVHGYNYGVRVCGCNITITNNIFYDNGADSVPSGVHDGEVDIMITGQYAAEVNHVNILISGNKCLSSNVHRNIDGGKNYWINNIIIDNNFCVSCLADGVTENKTPKKSQCILVGYAGESTNEKCVIISNNVCKNCGWAAIYVRAGSESQNAFTRYVALIFGNVVDNVRRPSTDTNAHIIAGIGVELGSGSLIWGNTVSNVSDDVLEQNASGISIGFVYDKCHCAVFGNYVRNCRGGILNDSFAHRIDIFGNRIENCINCIAIVDAERTGVTNPIESEYVNVSDNVVVGFSSIGISVQNIYGNNIVIKNNMALYGDSESTTAGIKVILRFATQRLIVEGNVVNTVTNGYDSSVRSVERNNNIVFKNNIFSNCSLALKISANGKRQLFLIEGNKFFNCTQKWASHSYFMLIWEGRYLPNGCFEFWQDEYFTVTNSVYGQVANAPLNFYAKKFQKGDVIISNSIFTRAICQNDAPASFTDADTIWKCDNIVLPFDQLGICAVKGQIAYDSTNNKMIVYNGSAWVNVDGSALS